MESPPPRAPLPSLHKVTSLSTLKLPQVSRSSPERNTGPGLCSDPKHGWQLAPKMVKGEEDEDLMSGWGAGGPGPVEGHSQPAVGNSPVVWFSPALRQRRESAQRPGLGLDAGPPHGSVL